MSIPLRESADFFIGSPSIPTFDQCNMYDIDYNNISQLIKNSSQEWQIVKCQNGWEFDLNQTRYSTIVSEV